MVRTLKLGSASRASAGCVWPVCYMLRGARNEARLVRRRFLDLLFWCPYRVTSRESSKSHAFNKEVVNALPRVTPCVGRVLKEALQPRQATHSAASGPCGSASYVGGRCVGGFGGWNERDPFLRGCNDKLFAMTKQTFVAATAIAKWQG